MKTSNIIVYSILIICLLLALVDKTIDNNTYFICIFIVISAYIIATEIKNGKDKSK